MATVVAKIVQPDGCEQSYGPIEIDGDLLTEVTSALQPLIALTDEQQKAAWAAQIESEVQRRNAEAKAANDQREALAAAGVDPDAEGAK